jgi:vacuolar-type H+-ATPase subunit H
MSGETEQHVSGWTVDTLMAHSTMRIHYERELGDERDKRYKQQQEADDRFNAERDRRYTEVKNAEEKALRIKEQADRDALGLAREIQTYKDEKANELREQISRERGEYVTQSQLKGVSDKIEATMKPILDFVAGQQGRSSGRISQQQFMIMIAGLFISTVGMIILVGGVVVGIAYAIKK